jgi:hypothetical protein
MFYRQDTTVSSLERLGEAGWLPDVRSEESLLYQACNQPPQVGARSTVVVIAKALLLLLASTRRGNKVKRAAGPLGRGSLGLMSRSDGLMSRPGPKTRNPGHKPQK